VLRTIPANTSLPISTSNFPVSSLTEFPGFAGFFVCVNFVDDANFFGAFFIFFIPPILPQSAVLPEKT
jgi:hypothetical protein